MNVEPATAEMTDTLAGIEKQRRQKEKELGVPVSCGWALRKVHEVLGREGKSPGTHAENTAHPANTAAATAVIGRLRKLARATGQRATRKGKPHLQRSWRDARPSESQPRRTMNRRGSPKIPA